MTLQQLFQQIGAHPGLLLFYFTGIPAAAILAGLLGKNEGHLSPWKYLYAVLIYLVSIPGVFAVALNIYFFVFQHGNVMEMDVYMQILPVVVMLITIFIISKNVRLALIPGFGKIAGLWFMLFATMAFMWFLEKIHIVVFSYMPITVLLGIFVVLFVLIYLGWRRFVA
ncbi:hypothetical protein [Emticicia fluvialis]|uniref:hypothetical protein n=1 Tax=Emticicia fluvialis TaxID=2974474 RepID=UPI0021660F1D|nr:hypothetical protein [Emticicia fluvialis]